MKLVYDICMGLSIGTCIGICIGLYRKTRYKHYTPERLEKAKRISMFLLKVLKYATLTCLALGLIWCVYFLVLAMMKPELAEYADNMSELIVSVLTVISIIFAFFEFIRRKE